jgi:hypothetical protein
MGRSTTRITALFLCALAAGAMTARADPVIPITDPESGTTLGTLDVTRISGVAPGWDEIDLSFASWTMTYPNWGPTFIDGVSGTWSGVGGNLGVSSLDGTDWIPQTTNQNSGTLLESFVNLDTAYNGIVQNPFARGPGSAGSYAWFSSGSAGPYVDGSGGWYLQNGSELGPINGPISSWPGQTSTTLLGKMYVTAGADVAFEGWFRFWDGKSLPNNLSEPTDVLGSFSTAVPEPSAAWLIGTGLVAVALRARRRRRCPVAMQHAPA